MERLLEAGADVNYQNDDRYNCTALIWAVWVGHAEIVELLISKGANPNLINNEGKTVLTIATEENYSEIVELLKIAGAVE